MKIQAAIAAARAFKDATLNDTAPPETIAARAEVCGVCPMRVPARGLAVRVEKALAAVAVTHGKPEILHGQMCGVCKCPLLLLVPDKHEVPHEDSKKEKAKRLRKAPKCWMRNPPLAKTES